MLPCLTYETMQAWWADNKVKTKRLQRSNHAGVKKYYPVDWKRDNCGQGVFFICTDGSDFQGAISEVTRQRKLNEPDREFFEVYFEFPMKLVESDRMIHYKDTWYLANSDYSKHSPKHPQPKTGGGSRLTFEDYMNDDVKKGVLAVAKRMREAGEFADLDETG